MKFQKTNIYTLAAYKVGSMANDEHSFEISYDKDRKCALHLFFKQLYDSFVRESVLEIVFHRMQTFLFLFISILKELLLFSIIRMYSYVIL